MKHKNENHKEINNNTIQYNTKKVFKVGQIRQRRRGTTFTI